MDIQFKRGEEQNRTSITPKVGEPVFTTDTKEMFIGDGVTPGGVPVGAMRSMGPILGNMVALFSGTTGKMLKGISKTDFLQGYATETHVASEIAKVPDIKVKNAVDADTLGGHSDYVREANLVTDISVPDLPSNRAPTAKAVNSAIDFLSQRLSSLSGELSDYILKSDIVTTLTSTDATKVLAASMGKSLKDSLDALSTNLGTLTQRADNLRQDVDRVDTATTANTTAVAAINPKVTALQVLTNTHTQHLGRLPNNVTASRSGPSGGQNGDIHLKY